MRYAYREVGSTVEAVEALGRAGPDATLMAGGTALVLLLRQGLVRPPMIISLRRATDLMGVRSQPDGGIEIGALTTHSDVEGSTVVQRYSPTLAAAFGQIATIRIRNQATLGGNLVHADPAQDPPPILLALGASAVLAGPTGSRTVPLDEFFVDYFETVVQPGEVLTAVRLPPLPEGAATTYVKFLPNSKEDYATVAVAARLTRDGRGRCTEVRIALGGVGMTPIRAHSAEKALVGQEVTDETAADAAALLDDDIDPLDDTRGSADYKRQMARVWVRRALVSLISPASRGLA
jgi:aerobic carbon-monoxide dehydrogenase medium subunit